MATASGLDILRREDFQPLLGKCIGLVCNQATVTSDFIHVIEHLAPLHRQGKLRIQIVLGPQHGLYGHTQDNMVEWEGADEPRTGLRIASLYGEHRSPTAEMLRGVEILVVDLPDIGSRYYTFLWTTALCIKECGNRGIPVMLLDRPNPIGGLQVQGTVLQSDFSSFVGLYPLPTRHGMTLGELAGYFRSKFSPNCDVTVIEVQDWSRSDYIDDTDVPWTAPSPNMPTLDTALVYPGGCLLEATNLSEGRGTTRPFELFGAPFLDRWTTAESLNGLDLPGVHFRPLQFQPTFQKHVGALCEGCFVHVTDRRAFEPAVTYVAILQEANRQAPREFAWNPPPYEYEYKKLPIDILAGNDWLRPAIQNLTPLKDIRERFLRECHDFEPTREACLLYPTGM